MTDSEREARDEAVLRDVMLLVNAHVQDLPVAKLLYDLLEETPPEQQRFYLMSLVIGMTSLASFLVARDAEHLGMDAETLLRKVGESMVRKGL